MGQVKRLGVGVLLVCNCMLLAITVIRESTTRVDASEADSKLRGTELEVVDKQGRVRLSVREQDDGSFGLHLYNSNGTMGASMVNVAPTGVSKVSSNELTVYDGLGRPRYMLKCDQDFISGKG